MWISHMNKTVPELVKTKLPDCEGEFPVCYVTKKGKQLCPVCANKLTVPIIKKIIWYDNGFERCQVCDRSLK